jgi:carbon-monoxide dehydrogenase small subunit
MLEILGESIVELHINGEKRSLTVRPADTLLYVLRECLGLTGAKDACGNGDCNACTVLLDGWPVKSCLMLAVDAIGHELTTLEGLGGTPMQEAFVKKFALQCGYCTPGMIVTSHALVNIHPDASDDTILEWMDGNICRCTGYQEIKEAIYSVLGR